MVGRAVIRRQHAAMTVHAAPRWWRLHIVAVQRVPKPLAGDVAPKLAHVLGLSGEQVSHRRDAEAQEALLHPLADTGNIPQGQLEQRPRHVVWMPDHVAVRLACFAGHLGKLSVGRVSNRAEDERADIVGNPFFEAQAQGARIAAFGWRDPAGQFSMDLTASMGMTAEISDSSVL